MKPHPVSVGWMRGVNNGVHLFQSTADINIQNAHKTRKKCMKCINYLSLLWFSLLLPNCEGSHSVFIYKFKDACTHERPTSTEHIRERERVFQDECPSFGAVWNALEMINKSGYVSRVTLPHKHEDTGANAALLTYLLNGDILLLLIRRWPLQQKLALGDQTRYSAAQRWPLVTTARLSRQHLSIAGGTFDHKNFIGGSNMVTHVCSNMLFGDDPMVRAP